MKGAERRAEVSQNLRFGVQVPVTTSDLGQATEHLSASCDILRRQISIVFGPYHRVVVITRAYYLPKQHDSGHSAFYKYEWRASCVPGSVLGTRGDLDELDKASSKKL